MVESFEDTYQICIYISKNLVTKKKKEKKKQKKKKRLLRTFNGTSLEEVTVKTYVNLDHVYNIYYLAHQVAHHFGSL